MRTAQRTYRRVEATGGAGGALGARRLCMCRARGGFTLLEVLAAGVILAAAAAVLGTALAHAYAALGEARDQRRAAVLLEELLTKIDMIGPQRVASEGPREGTFAGSDARYSWSADITSRPQGHLYEVAVTLTWDVAGRARTAVVHTYLNDPPGARDATLKWGDL